MQIRRLSPDEGSTTSVALQAYGFQPSPANDAEIERLREARKYFKDNVMLATA